MDGTGAMPTATEEGNQNRPRDRMLLQAVLRPDTADSVSAAFTVRVRNISPGGLMAECESSVGANDRVAIELRGIGQVQGTVAWVNGTRFGVAFDEPIDPKRVREQPKLAPEPIMTRGGFRKITHPLG